MTTTAESSGTALPVASPAQARRAAVRLARADGASLVLVIILNALTAAAGLAAPWLLGRIVDDVKAGDGAHTVDRLALAVVAFSVLQFIAAKLAQRAGNRFGERTLARVREEFIDRALALPESVVERAGTGDLVVRSTADVGSVAASLRDGVPAVFIALLQAGFIGVAVLVLNPLLGLCAIVGSSGIWFATRWYLRHARAAYLAQGQADSNIAEILSATALGARTIEALGIQQQRVDAGNAANAERLHAFMRTLSLRTVLFPIIDFSHFVPIAAVLLVGGALTDAGHASLGTVVAAALYLWRLSQPLDELMTWMDQLQQSGASFARVEGIGALRPDAAPDSDPPIPADDRIDLAGVCYAYVDGVDVLHDIDLTVQPGERLALVGPSGAGKSTLGRLIAGVDRPRRGRVMVGRVEMTELDPGRLRRQIVLVTPEHHIFIGTVRENLQIAAPDASDEELQAALTAIEADWVDHLPDGLDTELGHQAHRLDAAHAQQLALARVVLADPHTLVLDEATSMLDPTTARQTERALAAVLQGRTVIAIAHRLHTAHDADRIAVMDDGRLVELGRHAELVESDGTYARLWNSWQRTAP